MSGRSKVVVIFHEPVLGGATRSVLRTIPILEKLGWTFAFWTDRPSPLFDELRARGYEVAGAPRLVAWSLRVLPAAPGAPAAPDDDAPVSEGDAALRARSGPALVHANSLIALPEALAAKRSGAPVLLHVHEMSRNSVRGRIARRLAWRADELVAVSEASAAALASGRRFPRIVHEGAPVPADPLPSRKSPRPFVLGSLGVISTRKGSDLYVEAARLAAEREPGIEFRLVGGLTDMLEVDWGRRVIAAAQANGVVYKERVETLQEYRDGTDSCFPRGSIPSRSRCSRRWLQGCR
jgi:glycosyltransferase involved in cell wall biosynthesis